MFLFVFCHVPPEIISEPLSGNSSFFVWFGRLDLFLAPVRGFNCFAYWLIYIQYPTPRIACLSFQPSRDFLLALHR